MQVWNVLQAARWKCRTQKIAKNSPSGHHPTALSGYIFTTKACINNWKKTCWIAMSPASPHNMVNFGPSGWDLLTSLGHPSKFQRVLRLGSVTTRHSSSGRQPNLAALNRGGHLYSAGRPSRLAMAHILVSCSSSPLSQQSQIGCLPYFHIRCGFSANLDCRSEMWCTRTYSIFWKIRTYANVFYFSVRKQE